MPRRRTTNWFFSVMRLPLISSLLAGSISILAALNGLASEPFKVMELWKGTAPGEKGEVGEEADLTKTTDCDVGGKKVIRLGNVSKPTISIYKPVAGKNMGTAVLVCPGGAYRILAIDLEGTE